MSEIAERLKAGVAVLSELQHYRQETGDVRWGDDTEYAILVSELWDLEEDILRDPGALTSELVRVPRDYTSQ
jgi:hypothetical protein